MVLRKLNRRSYGRKLLGSIKYQNLHTFKQGLILLCQSILETENNTFTWLSSLYNPFKNFAKFTGKHLCWSFFLIKLQLQTPTQVFSYEYFKFLKNTYFEDRL